MSQRWGTWWEEGSNRLRTTQRLEKLGEKGASEREVKRNEKGRWGRVVSGRAGSPWHSWSMSTCLLADVHCESSASGKNLLLLPLLSSLYLTVAPFLLTFLFNLTSSSIVFLLFAHIPHLLSVAWLLSVPFSFLFLSTYTDWLTAWEMGGIWTGFSLMLHRMNNTTLWRSSWYISSFLCVI